MLKATNPNTRSFATRAVRAGLGTDQQHGAVVPPVYLTSTFTFAGYDEKRPYDYTRSGNPTRDALADALADIDGGAGAVVTSSGMSAVNLVLQLLERDDLLVAPHDCYGGTYRLLTTAAKKGAFRLEIIDTSDLSQVDAALERGPACCGWKPPAIRCYASPTSPPSAGEHGPLGGDRGGKHSPLGGDRGGKHGGPRWWRSTTPSSHLPCSGRLAWAPISPSTRRPNT